MGTEVLLGRGVRPSACEGTGVLGGRVLMVVSPPKPSWKPSTDKPVGREGCCNCQHTRARVLALLLAPIACREPSLDRQACREGRVGCTGVIVNF
jgi:hypothetical protein